MNHTNIKPFFETSLVESSEIQLQGTYKHLWDRLQSSFYGLPTPVDLENIRTPYLRYSLLVLSCMVLSFAGIVGEAQEEAETPSPEISSLIDQYEEEYGLVLSNGERSFFVDRGFPSMQNQRAVESYFRMLQHCKELSLASNMDIQVGIRPVFLYERSSAQAVARDAIPVFYYCVSPTGSGESISINSMSPLVYQINFIQTGHGFKLPPDNNISDYLNPNILTSISEGLSIHGDTPRVEPTTSDDYVLSPYTHDEVFEIINTALSEGGIQAIVNKPVEEINHRMVDLANGIRVHLHSADIDVSWIRNSNEYIFPRDAMNTMLAQTGYQGISFEFEQATASSYMVTRDGRELIYGPLNQNRTRWRITFILFETTIDPTANSPLPLLITVMAGFVAFAVVLGVSIRNNYNQLNQPKNPKPVLKPKQPEEINSKQLNSLVEKITTKLPNYLELNSVDFAGLLNNLLDLASDFVQVDTAKVAELLGAEHQELIQTLASLNLRDIEEPTNLINQLVTAYFDKRTPQAEPTDIETYNREVTRFNDAYQIVTGGHTGIPAIKNILTLLPKVKREDDPAIEYLTYSFAIFGQPGAQSEKVDINQLPERLAEITGIDRLRRGGARNIISSIIFHGRLELPVTELQKKLPYSTVNVQSSQNKQTIQIEYEHNAGILTFVFFRGSDDISISWQAKEG